MNTYIVLFRGINVGGRHRLPMGELVELLQKLGLANVKSYIQSGNVVCQSERRDLAALSEEISAAVQANHGFAPRVLLLRLADLTRAVSHNPFPQATQAPKSLHFYFLESIPPEPDLATLASVRAETEQFELIGDVFYLYAPDGIGRSRLAEKVEKALAVAATARNWRTVSKLLEMATAESG